MWDLIITSVKVFWEELPLPPRTVWTVKHLPTSLFCFLGKHSFYRYQEVAYSQEESEEIGRSEWVWIPLVRRRRNKGFWGEGLLRRCPHIGYALAQGWVWGMVQQRVTAQKTHVGSRGAPTFLCNWDCRLASVFLEMGTSSELLRTKWDEHVTCIWGLVYSKYPCMLAYHHLCGL